MEEKLSRVYIKIDDQNRLIQIEGEYTLSNLGNLEDCILIEEGEPCDRLNLAQSHYLEKPLRNDFGACNYKYVSDEVIERTEAEKEADRPVPTPSEQDIISAQLLYTATMTNTLIG